MTFVQLAPDRDTPVSDSVAGGTQAMLGSAKVNFEAGTPKL